MKKLIFIILFSFIFIMPVKAEEPDYYKEQYGMSGMDEVKEYIDEDALRFLEENGLDPESADWVNSINAENIFAHIWDFVKSGAKAPVRAGAAILSVILITAAITSFADEQGRFAPALFAATLAVAVILAADIWEAVYASAKTLKGASYFMLSFIPVFVGIVSLSGLSVTAASMGGLLIGGAQAVSSVSSFFALPMMGGYLSLSVCSTVSPLLNGSNIAATVKKITLWVLSLVTTLFLGILSIQTAVNSTADSLSMRTAKFILGTSVPVAGNVLAEALATVTASMGLLRSSIGIYGVVALAAMFLPIIIELILWRLTMMITNFAATFFSLPKISGLLKAVDDMLSLLVAVILLVAGMFIISLAVVITSGRA